ncbi:hypothetical protein AVEN_192201-1 [Araneus ventricosus]|uniref:Uncharacterized protein n=1 Tax=Araneus ventricosus TaxID=182803 RepID=A0A4Y2J3L6_ARAVE|nr:hypothetical protein AVEN_192201-1 [Araneus ventricosus]
MQSRKSGQGEYMEEFPEFCPFPFSAFPNKETKRWDGRNMIPERERETLASSTMNIHNNEMNAKLRKARPCQGAKYWYADPTDTSSIKSFPALVTSPPVSPAPRNRGQGGHG